MPSYTVDRTPGGGYWVQETDAIGLAGRAAGSIVGAAAGLALGAVARSFRAAQTRAKEASLMHMVATAEAGNWANLEVLARDYVFSHDDESYGYEALSLALVRQGAFENAIASAEVADRLGGDTAGYIRASAYLGMDDHARAIRECSYLVEDPDFRGDGFEIRARAFLWIGDLEQALEDATTALTTKPTSATYALRGDIQWARGYLEKAAGDYTRSLRLDPASAEAVGKRGAVYRQMGRNQEADADELAARSAIERAEDAELMGEARELLGIVRKLGWDLVIDDDGALRSVRRSRFGFGGLASDVERAIADYRVELEQLIRTGR